MLPEHKYSLARLTCYTNKWLALSLEILHSLLDNSIPDYTEHKDDPVRQLCDANKQLAHNLDSQTLLHNHNVAQEQTEQTHYLARLPRGTNKQLLAYPQELPLPCNSTCREQTEQ